MDKTSVLTVVGVVGGVLQYAGANGLSVPQDKQGWMGLGIALATAALGYLAKGTDKK